MSYNKPDFSFRPDYAIIKQNLTLRTDTKTYTVKDIKDEIKECVNILVSLGYTNMSKKIYRVTINSRAKRRLGQCTNLGGGMYEIQIGEEYLRRCSPAEIHNTIMHEVIHSVDGCMNHGSPWQSVAHKVNSYYAFTPITRCSNDKEVKQMVSEKARWNVSCPTCGKSWNWIRKPKYWDAYARSHCKGCGNKYVCKQLF